MLEILCRSKTERGWVRSSEDRKRSTTSSPIRRWVVRAGWDLLEDSGSPISVEEGMEVVIGPRREWEESMEEGALSRSEGGWTESSRSLFFLGLSAVRSLYSLCFLLYSCPSS